VPRRQVGEEKEVPTSLNQAAECHRPPRGMGAQQGKAVTLYQTRKKKEVPT
jgi:hypothetical protein